MYFSSTTMTELWSYLDIYYHFFLLKTSSYSSIFLIFFHFFFLFAECFPLVRKKKLWCLSARKLWIWTCRFLSKHSFECTSVFVFARLIQSLSWMYQSWLFLYHSVLSKKKRRKSCLLQSPDNILSPPFVCYGLYMTVFIINVFLMATWLNISQPYH